MTKRRRRLLIELGLLLVLHAALLALLQHQHIASSLLGGAGGWRLAVGLLFVLVRLVAVLFLPGIVLAELGVALYERLR